jgi:hypothetical protein
VTATQRSPVIFRAAAVRRESRQEIDWVSDSQYLDFFVCIFRIIAETSSGGSFEAGRKTHQASDFEASPFSPLNLQPICGPSVCGSMQF